MTAGDVGNFITPTIFRPSFLVLPSPLNSRLLVKQMGHPERTRWPNLNDEELLTSQVRWLRARRN